MADPQQVTVVGPDKKTYKFPPGTTKEKAINYFKKKGIGASVNKSTEPEYKPVAPEPSKTSQAGGKYSSSGIGALDWLLTNWRLYVPGQKSSTVSKTGSALDYISKELPAAGGALYGAAAGSKKTLPGVGMSALGGATGQAGSEIIQRLAFDRSSGGIPTGSPNDTNWNVVKDILVEGAKQGGLELAGRKTGDAFFYLLNKIPHAAIKNGIRLLPSDINGGKVTKYVEDLLSNLIPSAKTMQEYKAGQNKDVIGATEKLAKGFSRFRGTTEQMGQLLQDTYRTLEKTDRQALRAKAKTLANPKDIYKTAEYVVYEKNFKNELASKIAGTNKPELIGGYLRASSSLQETRNMMQLLDERGPKVANATRTRLLQDTLMESLSGQTDPVLKDLQKQNITFSGTKFKQSLDKIGEDKLKAIYGQDRYDNIMEFSKLVQHVGGTSGSGVGKFLNLIFLIGPLRSGLTLKTGQHIATEGFIFNRAAKIITSTEGVRLYENYIRATGIGSVKAISAARDALATYSQHVDAEYIQEKQDLEDQYYKDHPDEVKYRNLTP